uniref:Uncharacterized protein n=1 Tax=Manihot esculenta TaxID=3983 RepID=A0A2C9VII8_MANES
MRKEFQWKKKKTSTVQRKGFCGRIHCRNRNFSILFSTILFPMAASPIPPPSKTNLIYYGKY